MRVSYKKLWLLCIDRHVTHSELRKRTGLASATFTKLRNDQPVNLSVLLRIADVMNCDAGDIMEFLPDDALATDIQADSVW